MYTFEVTEDIMEVLTLKDIEPKELELVVYVNYVRQYKYEYEYVCSPSQVETKVTSGTKELKEGIYYDYDTDIEITLKSRDDKHYMLKVELNTDTKSETINTTTVGEVEDVKDIQYTNTNNNVAGFTVSRTLSTNYLIKIDIEAEVYDTNLVQNLYHQVDVSEASEGQSLLDKGDEIFKLVDHIYYKVEGTHKYGSEVKVRIYVELPPEEYDDEQYYSIDNVRIELNGSRLSITEVVDSEVEGSRVYESKYLLKGDIPLEQELNIYFYALYHVDLKRG